MTVASELTAIARADGGGGAIVMPSTVNTTITRASTTRPIDRRRDNRLPVVKSHSPTTTIPASIASADRHVVPQRQADLDGIGTAHRQLGAMDESVEEPVREHGSGHQKRQAPSAQSRAARCNDEGDRPGACRPEDAASQSVRVRKVERRLTRAGEVCRDRDGLPTEQYKEPQQQVQEKRRRDEDADVDLWVGASDSESGAYVTGEHQAR